MPLVCPGCGRWGMTLIGALTTARDTPTQHNMTIYRIAGNFRLEKIFAFFAQVHRGRKYFRRIILPSENFVTLKFLHAQVFTRGCQAVLVVPRQSAGIQTSICSLA